VSRQLSDLGGAAAPTGASESASGGSGSATGGGGGSAGADDDATYDDLLRGLRQEQEQVGDIIKHPY
jgi:hypothetical protein